MGNFLWNFSVFVFLPAFLLLSANLPFINHTFYFYLRVRWQMRTKFKNTLYVMRVYAVLCYMKKCLICFLRKHVCALIAWERICPSNKIKTNQNQNQNQNKNHLAKGKRCFLEQLFLSKQNVCKYLQPHKKNPKRHRSRCSISLFSHSSLSFTRHVNRIVATNNRSSLASKQVSFFYASQKKTYRQIQTMDWIRSDTMILFCGFFFLSCHLLAIKIQIQFFFSLFRFDKFQINIQYTI